MHSNKWSRRGLAFYIFLLATATGSYVAGSSKYGPSGGGGGGGAVTSVSGSNGIVVSPTTGDTIVSGAAFTTKANNLSDLASASSARTNLGLGSAAVQSVAAFAQTANNCSDFTAATCKTNLGLATIATSGSGADLSANSVTTAKLATTAVTPGSYTSTNLTVGADGRITAASNGSGGSGSGTVTTVTGSAPIVITSTPTTTPNVTITAASASAAGSEAANDKSFDDSRSWARAQYALAKALATDLTTCREIPLGFLGINGAVMPGTTDGNSEGGAVFNNQGGVVERQWTTTFQSVKSKSWAIMVRVAYPVPASGKVSEVGIIDSTSSNFSGPASMFAASTTKYVLRGGSSAVATTTTVNTAFHDFVVVNDKTNVSMYTDSTDLVSFPTSQLAADDARGPTMFASDAAAIKLLYFWFCWV